MAELISVLTTIFVASALVLLTFKKLGQPALPAYMVAGLAVGFFVDQSNLLGLAELGIVFLVFIFGIRFDPGRIRSVAGDSMVASTFQISLIGSTSFVIALQLGLHGLEALYFSLAAALSSSMIGLELLEKEVENNLIHGRLSESINLIQDIVGLTAIILLSTPAFYPGTLVQTFLYGVSLLTAALIVRKYFMEIIGEQIGDSSELLMLTSLSILALFLSASELLKLSPVIGSFAAGLSVARFPYSFDIIDTVGSLKDFFSAIFFVSLGALVSFPGLETVVITVFLVVFTLVAKPLTAVIALLERGYDSRTSYLTGFGLDQVSEYVLVIVIQALIAGKISEPLFNAIILASVISMSVSAYTTQFGSRFYSWVEQFDFLDTTNRNMKEVDRVPEDIENHTVLIGYDVQGKKIAQELRKKGEDFIVVENDPEKIEEARKNEDNYVYANIENPGVWERLKVEKADLIVSTVPFRDVSENVLEANPKKDVILRSKDFREAHELIEMGAAYVAMDDILVSEILEELVVEVIRNPEMRKELRRRNLLEVKRYLQGREG